MKEEMLKFERNDVCEHKRNLSPINEIIESKKLISKTQNQESLEAS